VNRPSIELHIEELVLEGFPAGDQYRIAEALEQELARLFAERGVPGSLWFGSEVPLLDAGAFRLAAPVRPKATGGQIAGAVYAGLSGLQGHPRETGG